MKKIYSKRNLMAIENKKTFVGFLPTGYPNSDDFVDIIRNLRKTGIDIFEFGYPPKIHLQMAKFILRWHCNHISI